jgi:cold shock CspA family protein
MDEKKNLHGKVTEFYPVRGYGYLHDEKKAEYCFYSNDILKDDHSLEKGDQVTFDVYVGHGVRAINVRK